MEMNCGVDEDLIIDRNLKTSNNLLNKEYCATHWRLQQLVNNSVYL